MKTIKSVLTVVVLLTVFTVANAQQTAVIKIKTSAQCEMCEEKMESKIAFEKGVKDVDLDVKSKILTVTYKTSKTSPEKIRKAVTELGYDADNLTANADAYSKLPSCCKKPATKNTSTKKHNCGSKKGCGGNRPGKCQG